MSSRIRIALDVEQPHANFWQAAIRGSPHAEVAGVYSDTPGLAASFAEKYGFAATGDLPALIDAADAVAICSVTTRHADLIEMAAAKGRKILCEKPLATSIAHLDRIERAVADAGVFFMQGFPKRYDPVNHEIKRIVDSGRLGPIHCVRVRHGHPVGVINPAFAQSWFTDPALGGFGALLDEGCHACDFLRWLFGEPESVICMTAGESLGLRVEDVGIAVYRFPGGLLAEVASSWGFIGAENSIEIFGSRGAIVVSGVDLGSRDLTEGGYLKIYALDEAGQAGAIIWPRGEALDDLAHRAAVRADTEGVSPECGEDLHRLHRQQQAGAVHAQGWPPRVKWCSRRTSRTRPGGASRYRRARTRLDHPPRRTGESRQSQMLPMVDAHHHVFDITQATIRGRWTRRSRRTSGRTRRSTARATCWTTTCATPRGRT
jgi:predicted dehydrogenase